MSGLPPDSAYRDGYEIAFEDDFESPQLDTTRWFPFYLPQWSNRRLAAARYTTGNSTLRLHVDVDQEPWCPEFDGVIRVSSVQTGCFAGPLGASVGQHRFNPQLVVREEQATVATYTPQYGYLEARLKAVAIPGYMVALWMIGFERHPSESAEICICEIFGTDVGTQHATVGYGLHPFGDQRIREQFYRDKIEMDARQYHLYAVDWKPGYVEFYLDNKRLRRIEQSPGYPMQLMLGIYELPHQIRPGTGSAVWPKTLEVDYVRGYREKVRDLNSVTRSGT